MNALMQHAGGGSCASEEWPMLYLGVVAVLAGCGFLVNLIALWVCVNVEQPVRTWAVAMVLLPWIGLVVALVASVGLGLDAVDRGGSPWWFLLAGAGAHLGALAVVALLAWSGTRRAYRDGVPAPDTAAPGARTGGTRGCSEPVRSRPSAVPVGSPRSQEEWRARVIRRPDDVGYGVLLPWLAEKYFAHYHRLVDRDLPSGCHPGETATADDALAVLALGESIHRMLFRDRSWFVDDAMRWGATWIEVAAALDVTTGRARSVLRSYAETQRKLYEETERTGDRPLGYSAEKYRSALALIRLADDARSPSAA
ncbi:cytochrome d ubiquinol oxidase subunit II [Streptomyces qinzhouensis]|uniref:Cytochrome d ubiquinol oxidase subunit II n=1 Tax=Streptomyces qinzhouensis TaxID=2599401 RepID=A0A5B8JRM5_9ACTN|nr:cytochrome d ubiquinol oxidase subunit II [Streptomyces qinzhouensis]QDY75148.1 cytochrome d ubiquinol oxidase subunit II [Streptomyces qinzhouensis]QDY80650.1 cytochrome d ubiquinol oxidase subunit II [Streptomyces qinzhouensis]